MIPVTGMSYMMAGTMDESAILIKHLNGRPCPFATAPTVNQAVFLTG
ncbi:hypothetical protein [Sphingobium phenoxybenzoativorans]|nr:hypothetical protein [Sphingobium phenoxybenzoativorans]